MKLRGRGHPKTKCGIHGDKYFVFKKTGPCMHPDCAAARIKLWASTDKEMEKAFRPVLHQLGDFISWGMTDGEKILKFRWGSKEAWANSVSSFLRKKRIERAQRAATMEVEKLLFFVDSKGSNGTGDNAGKTVFPDSHLWVRECSQYLVQEFNESMAAYFLGIIDLFDLAKLCYAGDVTQTKEQVQQARQQLREWSFG